MGNFVEASEADDDTVDLRSLAYGGGGEWN